MRVASRARLRALLSAPPLHRVVKCVSFVCDSPRGAHRVRINSGVDMRPARVDVSDPVAPPIVRPAPPHIGIGSEEDSMGSVRALVPKPPKQVRSTTAGA